MRLIIFSVLIALSFLQAFSPLLAQNMRSDNYEIQMGNINMTAGEKTSENFKLGDTVGQTASGLYESTGFTIGAGFWYITGIIPFSFTISNLDIAFGQLIANNPQILTNTLTVSAGGAGGYQVLAFETHPLKSASDNYIPDVLGDNGDINEETASTWGQNTTYGFGFKITGDDIPDDFNHPDCSPNCYRQFADPTASPPEESQIIMSSDNVTRQSETTVSYKVNVSGAQEAGHYQNQIVFMAIPKY
ncbi:MAG: hypothetical protein PHR64_00705 [Candidatus Shapirobacteria bacterium]|nr:hypothetical protein [Candidatus Shapirobacteria bacterium]MDD5074002.1 hypothetical protein [Candidatus Shapirobacteria bacterium]MDD5481457.1 hypothetical protein [Candidatus Shapirobacteria bacterium]